MEYSLQKRAGSEYKKKLIPKLLEFSVKTPGTWTSRVAQEGGIWGTQNLTTYDG